ncbi:sensor histidine kinase [Kribbella solani]|uniref:histidine kinase n=1 Tax=Kribbella solani TaxID=236067 RepID=A0A841DG44_9ACTN|nr:HAMP domain-containing sensor histidine kinase [Kribbella solani]MBB5977482.1 signal transduction histidine kinase [Kribbella solani]MDX2972102.1 HAMP domain-containing sensor histidine kinase [Kribbella solani]MDX3001808.1 HAMP domain-containing sensor histidine kinase [Kribbella solani]
MGLTGFRARIVSLAVLTATLVVAVLVVLSHVLLTRATEADTRTLARTRAEAVAATVEVADGKIRSVEGTGDAFDTVTWVYADGRLLDGVLHSATATTVERLGQSTRADFVTVDHFLLYAEPVPVPGHQVTAVVMVDLTPYESSEQRSLVMSLILGALAIVLAGGVAYLVVSRALRVVRRMSTLADEWGDHDPDRRFGTGPPRDEFGQLAQTFDRLLDRVSDTIADERRLTDEIAHELRTPMSVLRGEAQLAELAGTQVDPQLVLTETDRLSAAVSTILDAARSRTRHEASCRLTTVLDKILAGRDQRVRLDAPAELDLAVPADVAAAVLAPLVDNATRHARSTVTLRAEVAGDRAVVHVIDDGPGFQPDELDKVFAPGHSGSDGHGLGLAVVRRIATATGIGVQAVADGNGHVEVSFPVR